MGGKYAAVERLVMLRIMDSLWIEHLTMMEYMRRASAPVNIGAGPPGSIQAEDTGSSRT